MPDPLQILTAEPKLTFFDDPNSYTSLISAAELDKLIMFCNDNDQIENGDWKPMIEAVNHMKSKRETIATIFQGGINYDLLTNLFKEFIIYYKKYISKTCGVFLLFHGNENVVFKLNSRNDKRMIKETTIIYEESEESTKYRPISSKILKQFENYYCYTITGHKGNAFKFLFCSPYPSNLFRYFSDVKTYIPLFDICFFILYLHEINRKKTENIEKDDVMFMQTFVIKSIISMTEEARLFFPPNNMINIYDQTRNAYHLKKKLGGGGSINFLFFAVMLIIIVLFFFSYCSKKVNMRLGHRNTSPYKTIDL